MENNNKIFISYAHGDGSDWLKRVKTHINVLKQDGVEFEIWDDTRIKVGTKWKEEIQKELDRSFIAILLVSTNFLASDFIRQNELPPLLKSAELKGTNIIPVIVSPCRFTKTEILKDFQSLNDPARPLSECNYSEQERILVDLVNEIEEIIAKNTEKYLSSPNQEKSSVSSQNHIGEDYKIEAINNRYLGLYPEMTEDEDLFFYDRLVGAFPGVRGIKIIEDPVLATKRLLKLLYSPLKFYKWDGEMFYTPMPIWWFSRGSSMHIEKVELIDSTKILIDRYEMRIRKIAVINHEYYNSCVYVEVDGEAPTGLYKYEPSMIAESIKEGERFTEEYGLYKEHLISREEYDDGAAEIGDDVVPTAGEAKLRIRNLTPFNFIITGHHSSLNSKKFDRMSSIFFPDLLTGKKSLESLNDIIDNFHKRDYYD